MKNKDLIKVISVFSSGFFVILMMIGIIGVITHELSNAGYAAIPALFAIISISVYRKNKNG